MSVTAARGWLASAVRAGTKREPGALDTALVLSAHPATVAAAFTTNRLQGGHVHVCRPRAARGVARGVVVSAGISNSATGKAGVEDAARLAAAAAAACGVPEEEMLVASTGTIGNRIPLDLVLPAIPRAAAALSPEGGAAAAQAILTTDTRTKEARRTLEVGGRTVTVGGMAKGAGMICPRLEVAHATMLAFLTTDGAASAPWLREVLGTGLGRSFNAITVDGSTSTCDSVFLFANGAAGVAVDGSPAFARAVHEVMEELAYQIVADGEGATKVLRIRVRGAATEAQAEAAARALAGSMLLRAAIWGGDPNWGRVAQTLGQATEVAFDPDLLRVAVGGVELAVRGLETGRREEARRALAAPEVALEVDLGLGRGGYELLTCDLSPAYVTLQAET